MYPSTHPPRQDSHLHRRNPVPLTRPHHSPCSPPHAARLRAKGGKRRRRRDPARSQTAASPHPPPASPQRRPAITPPAHVTHLQPPRPPGRGLRRPLAAAAAPRGDRPPPHTPCRDPPPVSPCPPGPGHGLRSRPLVLRSRLGHPKRSLGADSREASVLGGHTTHGGCFCVGALWHFPCFSPIFVTFGLCSGNLVCKLVSRAGRSPAAFVDVRLLQRGFFSCHRSQGRKLGFR